jgi:hypothetical protein
MVEEKNAILKGAREGGRGGIHGLWTDMEPYIYDKMS